MIIKSYLAYSIQGRHVELKNSLNALAGCEVIPATNREILILVTESEDEKAEEELEKRLRSLEALQTLTLVSGHNEAVDAAHKSVTA